MSEYDNIVLILKENTEIREMLNRDLKPLALDLLNKQFNRLYTSLDLKVFTLIEIEQLDGV